jgi:hypothetical protein
MSSDALLAASAVAAQFAIWSWRISVYSSRTRSYSKGEPVS